MELPSALPASWSLISCEVKIELVTLQILRGRGQTIESCGLSDILSVSGVRSLPPVQPWTAVIVLINVSHLKSVDQIVKNLQDRDVLCCSRYLHHFGSLRIFSMHSSGPHVGINHISLQ